MSEEKTSQEILYQVDAKRDADMLKAFVTFVYRVNYPRVSSNFIVYGLVIFFIPFTITKHPIISGICFAIGAFMVLMGLFRQYIPVTRMKKRDPDYISGVITTYSFSKNELKVYRDGELHMIAGNYQKINSFYSDEYYYYLGMNDDDLFVLPRRCFTTGDPDEFQQFICQRSRLECRWIPVTLKNKFLRVKARFSGR
jgi:hypothetical protein